MQLKQNFNDFRTHFPKIFLVKPENINTTKYTVFKLMNVEYRLLPDIQFQIFGPNLTRNGLSSLKKEKGNITNKLSTFKLVQIPNFTLSKLLKIFQLNLPPKDDLCSKPEKVSITVWFSIFELFSEANFSFNMKFSFCVTNLAEKDISGVIWKKVNITIDFCTFKLVQVPNFTLRR